MNWDGDINLFFAWWIIHEIDVVLVVVNRRTIIIANDAAEISSAPVAALLGFYLHALAEELQSYVRCCWFGVKTPVDLWDFVESAEASEEGVEALWGRDIILLGVGEEVDVVGKATLGSKVTDALFV